MGKLDRDGSRSQLIRYDDDNKMAAAATVIPGWFYVDFHYGVEDWVRRYVYVAESVENSADANATSFRLVRIEDESPARVIDGDGVIGRPPLRGRRTGAGEFYLLEGWGQEPLELTHTLVLPTLEGVPA